MKVHLSPHKRLLSLAAMLLVAVLSFAQDDIGSKLSITTQMFLNERDGKIDVNPSPQALKGYTVVGADTLRLAPGVHPQRLYVEPTQINGINYIAAFIRLQDNSDVSPLEEKGVQVQCKFDKGLVTALIPVDSIESVARLGQVTKVDVSELKQIKSNVARQVTNVDDVLNNTSDAREAGLSNKYDGSGVVVGVIDQGIDYQHKAFKDASNNYRLKRVYNSTNGSSATEYSSFTNLTTDNSSEDHGTHTSSTAGGSSVVISGSSTNVTTDHANATYGGMAPASDLYLVGTYNLGSTVIANGFQKICEYADAQGEPVVVSNSWGSSMGPRDGSGSTADIVNQYFGDSNPNHICLFAASNDAGKARTSSSGGGMYISGTSSSSNPLGAVMGCHYYSNTNDGYYYTGILAEAWTKSSSSANFTVRLLVLNASTGAVLASQTATASTSGASISLSQYYSGSFYVYKNYYQNQSVGSSSKTQIMVYANGSQTRSASSYNSNYILAIQIYPTSGSADLDIWGSGYTYFTNSPSSSGYTWTQGDDKSSVSEEATITSAIPIGAYVSKNSVTDYNSSTHSLTSSYPNVGDIAYFSSYQEEGAGSTGNLIPWISAPGATIVAAVNHRHTSSGYMDDYYADYNMYRVNSDTSNPYGSMEGTSMATPVAAGIVALWLQAAKEVGHELTTSEVKTIMKETAINDTWTTTGSNHTHFGNGKIDALAGIKYILNTWGSTDPTLSVDSTALHFSGNLNQTTTKTVTVTKAHLAGNVTATISGTNSSVFSVSPATIASADGTAELTVGFTPTALGTFTGTLTLSSDGAQSVTVALTGTAAATLTADPTSLTFSVAPGSTSTQTVTVKQSNLTSPVAVAVSGNGFSVSPTSIEASAESTDLTVTFAPTAEGTYTGTLTLTSGSLTATVALNGTSNDGGTASDAYLNVAKYKTIDDAGWATSSVDNYYTYTEYADDNVAWLTVPSYGVMQSTSYQKWTAASSATSYSSSWSATDIFPASSSYFTSATSRAVYSSSGSASQTFYVTNVTAAKGYGYNYSSLGSSSSSLTLNVYECTLNSDGSLTASTTAAGTASNSTGSYRGVITVDGLDASKIYQVVFSANNNADGYAVAFQTPLNVVKTPVITATPTALTFSTEANTPVTQTFTVSGTDLTGNVTATLADDNNVYSLSSATATVAEATAGKTITVTFSPTEAGAFTGTVTLKSDGAADVTVSLNGTATEQTSPVRYKSTATDDWHYLLPDADGAYNVTDQAYYAFEVTEEVENATVNYTRSFTNGVWAAWSFPIDITVDADLLANYQFGYLEGVSNNGNDIDKDNLQGVTIGVKLLTEGQTVKANLPYVILPQTSGSHTFDITGTLKRTNPTSTSITGNAYTYTSTGVYTRKDYNDDLWYALTTDGMFQIAGSGAYLNPFRFYLSITDNTGNPYDVKNANFRISLNDETTGIFGIKGADTSNLKIYDLQGRRVYNPTQKGVYIVNGRKMVLGK